MKRKHLDDSLKTYEDKVSLVHIVGSWCHCKNCNNDFKLETMYVYAPSPSEPNIYGCTECFTDMTEFIQYIAYIHDGENTQPSTDIKLEINYDREADVLYIGIKDRSNSYGDEFGDLILLKDMDTEEITGLTIMDFSIKI